MPRETGEFKVRERVLVSFTDQKYEAKIVKAEKHPDGGWRYFIHYPGWNKSHDEWVPATELCKYDESQVNVKLPTALPGKDAQKAPDNPDLQLPQTAAVLAQAPPQSKSASQLQPAASQLKQRSSDKRPKKRPRTAPEAATNSFHTEPILQAELDLPLGLKQVLLEEHRTLSQEDRLPPPPHHPTIADILAGYIDHSTSKDADAQAFEVAAGVQEYFDRALPQLLLYDEELDDYKDTNSEIPPSSMYGGQHLLRLMVKLPDLLPAHPFSASSYTKLQQALLELVGYLQDNITQFFPASADRL